MDEMLGRLQLPFEFSLLLFSKLLMYFQEIYKEDLCKFELALVLESYEEFLKSTHALLLLTQHLKSHTQLWQLLDHQVTFEQIIRNLNLLLATHPRYLLN